MIKLKNESKHEFAQIVGRVRHYYFPDGEIYTIVGPRYLSVSKSGGHRVVDDAGVGHYVRPGWLAVSWTVAEDEAHFTI